jgi:hypothetical protein
MANPWKGEEFDIRHYPQRVQRAIIRTRYQAERQVRRCSVCGRKRQIWGVLCHHVLKQIKPSEGMTPKAYALCQAHMDMTTDEIGRVVYGDEAWGQTAPAAVA